MGILKKQDEKCPLAKINILLQFGSEILVLSCTDNPIQILVILSHFQMFRTETIRRICME